MAIAVDVLDDILEETWLAICRAYDVSADLPDAVTLFESVNLDEPDAAARQVILNMLVESMEYVDRFSPWYTMPACAFGLTQVRDCVASRIGWELSPEAAQRWQGPLAELAEAIRDNTALLEADSLLSELLGSSQPQPCVVARCACEESAGILVSPVLLEDVEIICKACRQPFRPAANT